MIDKSSVRISLRQACLFFIVVLVSIFFVVIASKNQVLATNDRLVGMYISSPGGITDCAPAGTAHGWPTGLPTNPLFNNGQQYTTDTSAYLDNLLTTTASMGMDFLMIDESNGFNWGCSIGPPFYQSLLLLFDIADARIQQGIPTPRLALMAPPPGAPNAEENDNDQIYDEFVHDNGEKRPSYFWLDGHPVWGVYTASSFETTYNDSRYTIRYICNSANNDCTQTKVDLGTVWPWQTQGNLNSLGCPASSQQSPSGSCPLFSSNSKEITIQNGYQNIYLCTYYGHSCPGGTTSVGFTSGYYTDQWNFATSHPSVNTIIISMYDGVEGGWIQARNDFSPATNFEDITRTHVQTWKGDLDIADVGPPPAPPMPQAPTACGVLSANEGLLQNQSLWSCDGRFHLSVQPDGNIVAYDGTRAYWQTFTLGSNGAGAYELLLQPDGNLVAYTSEGGSAWNTHTSGYSGATFKLQNDGNLVITQNGTQIWSSNTPQPPLCSMLRSGESLTRGESIGSCVGYQLILQPDGNLVLYGINPPWVAPGTFGLGHHLIMQPDGNLVVYDGANNPVWHTGTWGHPGAYLIVQPDSNMVIFRADGQQSLWSRY